MPFGLGGYILQYMFTVSGSRAEKFLTNDFIPVETDTTVSAAAVDGSIDALNITPGSNYTAGTYYAAIKGDGTGGVVKIIADGGIAAFGSAATNTQIFSAGTGYTHGTVDLSAVFTDSALTTTTSIGGSADAVIQPIISPKGCLLYTSPSPRDS